MKKWMIAALLFTSISVKLNAQGKVFTKSGTIAFFSKTTVENIEAVNKKVLGVIDFTTNKMEFSVLIKGFIFPKALMQEHFNENYMESTKFPKATFKGAFAEAISLGDNETKTVKVEGDLTIHGVTKKVSTTATISQKNGQIFADTKFNLLLADYNIKVPSVNKSNVNNQIQITVTLTNMAAMK